MDSAEMESKKPESASKKSSTQNPPSQGSTLPTESDDWVEGDSPKSDSKRKRSKKKISSVWDNFTVIKKVSKGKVVFRAQCKHCLQDYAYDSHKQGTTSYSRHSKKCSRTPRTDGDVGDLLINAEGRLQSKKIDQMVVRDLLAKCVIEHDLPFSFVEYTKVRMLLKYLNPDVQPISRKTVASDIFKLYENEKLKLKRELAEVPGRINFTSDLWTALTVEGYMCLTAHYIDKDWNLQNRILAFVALPPPHTGMELAMKLLDLWREWGIEKKVFSITLDNASNNDTMQNIVKRQLVLEDKLMCKGEFFT